MILEFKLVILNSIKHILEFVILNKQNVQIKNCIERIEKTLLIFYLLVKLITVVYKLN